MSAPPPIDLAEASDADLIRRIALRDRAAFAMIFERFAGRVKGFMLRGGCAEQDADEITQDVMVLIWRRAETFDPARAGVSTWIFTIARNRRIDLIRRHHLPLPDPNDPLFRPEPEPSGLETLSATEREVQVRAAMEALAQDQRDVLIAAFYQGLSHGEIAETLDLPLGTVKSRIRLAFRHLRGVLGDELAEELSDG